MDGFRVDQLLEEEHFFYTEAYNCVLEKKNACLAQGVLIAERNPQRYWGSLLATVEIGVPVFLCNPDWRSAEWDQLAKWIKPAIIFGEIEYAWDEDEKESLDNYSQFIMIPTGGSSGKLKFAMHTWENLVVSAKATQRFLNASVLNFVSVLPLYHVSGLMQSVRSLITGGRCYFLALDRLLLGAPMEFEIEDCYLSLVPTQLIRLLASDIGVNRLKRFKLIFVGGAALSRKLYQETISLGINVSLTYGSTETASMIAASEVRVSMSDEIANGKLLSHARVTPQLDGMITSIECDSLYYGYFPEIPKKQKDWMPQDRLEIDKTGELVVRGRLDRMINSGGEKIDPQEVEDILVTYPLVRAALVIGVPDCKWGERVVAFYESNEGGIEERTIKEFLKKNLVSYKVPKDYVYVEDLPFDEKGKISKTKIEILWLQHTKNCSKK